VPAAMTPLEAAGAIVAHCPDWVVDSVEHLGEGDFCSAFLVNDAWVFRFAKHAAAEASLRREWCLLPQIAQQFEIRIPSPQLLRMDTPPRFLAHPMLPGPELTQDRYLQLGEGAREQCTQQLGKFLFAMHSTDPQLARQCGVEVTDQVHHHRALLSRARLHLAGKLAERELSFVEQTISAYVEAQAEEPSPFRAAVLHGDLGPDHVLYDERTGAVTGVIDFGDVTIGDPAWDLVYIYEDYGLDFLDRLLRTYLPDDPGSLLRRLHRFYVLNSIEWTVRCAEQTSAELDEAMAHLVRLRITREQQLRELLSACHAA
jgi:aminoglycoside 2''-phosphotransferase